MGDYFEVDFLRVEAAKSGDAITVRYTENGYWWVHVVDAGYQDTGAAVAAHIRKYYTGATFVRNVVATHPDGDHSGGLRTVLEEFDCGQLWMLRPWHYASEIIHRFPTYTSVEHLQRRLRAIYSNIAALEEIAIRRGIAIREPFQGQNIGPFTVLAPTKARYLDMIVESERTPESVKAAEATLLSSIEGIINRGMAKAANLYHALWGEEVFSTNETSAENEMSVVQYANLCGQRILLTADAGRKALAEAAIYAPVAGLLLPGIDRFQVPHHGSRRNVSSALLDQWLGPRCPQGAPSTFQAFISSAAEDKDHPRKSVVRAMIHRGARVFATEGQNIWTSKDAPPRGDYYPLVGLEYPEENEAS